MFNEDREALSNYPNLWSEFPDREGNSPFLSDLFDNLFGWIDNVKESDGYYRNIDELSNELVAQDPSFNISALDDGFKLEVERLDAIRQYSSRGFTIYDINPGLLSESDYPLNIPYEFIFDGTNFIPDTSDSIIKNFRSIELPNAGNFVKVEYIYENNSSANVAPYNRRPYAGIKYQGALINGSENDLRSNYSQYYFDNYARNKVYLGFGDVTQKPHIITRSGDYFKTYFNTLVLSLNIGAPKIRVTIGFNSEKYDGPDDGAINSNLSMMGGARLFRDIDTPLVPFNANFSDITKPTPSIGVQLNTTTIFTTYNAVFIRAFSDPNSSTSVSFGYSLLFITNLFLYYNTNSIAVAYDICYELLVSNPAGDEIRLFKYPLSIDASVGSKKTDMLQIPLAEPLRVVIPYNSSLYVRIIYRSGGATTFYFDIGIQGYSLGSIRKLDRTINYDLITSKFITDSTFLTDFNRIEVLKDA